MSERVRSRRAEGLIPSAARSRKMAESEAGDKGGGWNPIIPPPTWPPQLQLERNKSCSRYPIDLFARGPSRGIMQRWDTPLIPKISTGHDPPRAPQLSYHTGVNKVSPSLSLSIFPSLSLSFWAFLSLPSFCPLLAFFSAASSKKLERPAATGVHRRLPASNILWIQRRLCALSTNARQGKRENFRIKFLPPYQLYTALYPIPLPRSSTNTSSPNIS